MGILDRIGLGRKNRDLAYLSSPAFASPWGGDDAPSLSQIVLTDIFPDAASNLMPLSREEALSIPAVAKARNLLVSSIAPLPLLAMNADGPLAPLDQPTFLYRTNNDQSPYERLAATVDDCIFFGKSLWLVDRGSDDQITNAYWIPSKDWQLNDGVVSANDVILTDGEYLLFHIPLYSGLLKMAQRTLRGARDTELAWTARIKNPIFITELSIEDGELLTQEDIDVFEAYWLKKHAAGQPSFGVTPAGAKLIEHAGGDDSKLFIENRNAVRTDVGSFVNVRASMLDGTAGIDSLTYSTTAGERNSFYEFDMPLWTDPIQQRLSMDDVVPRGQRVRFDMSEINLPIPTSTGAPEQD
jgi:hypothetical protein